MEKKITLTEIELQMLHKNVDRTFSPMTATEEECKAMTSVIHKAEALMHELKAYEESGDDMMAWFLGKYEAQENNQENQ